MTTQAPSIAGPPECHVCGTKRKWIEQKPPALSNYEPCPLHVDAKRLRELCGQAADKIEEFLSHDSQMPGASPEEGAEGLLLRLRTMIPEI